MVSETAGDFFVTENDDGTYTVDRNREVVGVNLVFRITILQITKAS
jgi:FKBP-type peptidyl-prolyl cis-trans isomerase 2